MRNVKCSVSACPSIGEEREKSSIPTCPRTLYTPVACNIPRRVGLSTVGGFGVCIRKNLERRTFGAWVNMTTLDFVENVTDGKAFHAAVCRIRWKRVMIGRAVSPEKNTPSYLESVPRRRQNILPDKNCYNGT